MNAIRTKPIDELSWQDIEALAASGAAEDAMLEFKGLLPEKNGKQHPWYDGRDVMTEFTRDALAAEVVALANAYGGRLIIGIAETQERPRKPAGTALVPRCGKFAEQFEQALGSLIDPPLGGLHVRAIVNPATEDAGAVVVAVPSSDLAPHGVGRPPLAYVRRGTSCEAMTMRDLQSVFWEARTKRERVDALRASFRRALERAYQFGPSELTPPAEQASDERGAGSATPMGGATGLFVRITAIFQHPIGLDRKQFRAAVQSSRLPVDQFDTDWWMPFGGGRPMHEWRPRAHGVQGFDRGPSLWTVLDDGTVNVLGFSPGPPAHELKNTHFPGSFVLHAAQVLVMAERLRRRAGRPDVPIEIDIEFLHDGHARALEGPRVTRLFAGQINQHVEIGPFLFSARSEAAQVLEEIEFEIWAGMGFNLTMPVEFDVKRWFAGGP